MCVRELDLVPVFNSLGCKVEVFLPCGVFLTVGNFWWACHLHSGMESYVGSTCFRHGWPQRRGAEGWIWRRIGKPRTTHISILADSHLGCMPPGWAPPLQGHCNKWLKIRGSKQQRCGPSGSGVQKANIRYRWGWALPEESRGGSFLPLPAPGGLPVVLSGLSLQTRHAHLGLCRHMSSPGSLCRPVSKFSSSFRNTNYWISTHPNPVQPHLSVKTFAKTLLLNQVNLTGRGVGWRLELHYGLNWWTQFNP